MVSKVVDYVELRCRSAFSFLDGASLPEDLAGRALELGYGALAVADPDGLYAAPRFHAACARLAAEVDQVTAPRGGERHDLAHMEAWAARFPLRPIFGAHVALAEGDGRDGRDGRDGGHELLLLVEDLAGWKNLSRLLTAARIPRSASYVPSNGKVASRVSDALLGEYAGGLIALLGGGGGACPVGSALRRGDEEGGYRALRRIADLVGPKNIYLEVERHHEMERHLGGAHR